jgi:hypothetical protein
MAPAFWGGANLSAHEWFNLDPPEARWYFGAYGGYALNTLWVGMPRAQRTAYHIGYGDGHGWTIGIPVRFQFFNWFAVQAEPALTAKNYVYTWASSPDSATYRMDVSNLFLDFPLTANLSWGFPEIGLRVYMETGFYVGLWVSGRRRGTASSLTHYTYDVLDMGGSISRPESFSEAYEFDERRDSRFDGGFVTGLGLQYDLRKLSFFIDARYNLGLADLQKPYYRNFAAQYNDTWTFKTGVLLQGRFFGGGN